jgi:hypothetical protein
LKRSVASSLRTPKSKGWIARMEVNAVVAYIGKVRGRMRGRGAGGRTGLSEPEILRSMARSHIESTSFLFPLIACVKQ